MTTMTKRPTASSAILRMVALLFLIWFPIASSSFQTTSSSPRRPRIKGYSNNRRGRGASAATIIHGETATSTAVGAAPMLVMAEEEVVSAPVVTKRKAKKSKVVRKKKTKKTKTVVKKTPLLLSDEEDQLVLVATTTTAAAASKKKTKKRKVSKGSKQKKDPTIITKKKKKKKKSVDFWSSNKDDATTESSVLPIILVNQTHVECTVYGNPQPLKRHRTARGFMYNPSAKAQQCFQSVVEQQIMPNNNNENDDNKMTMIPLYNDNDDELIPTTHFGSDALLHVQLVFYCRRPKAHFISNKSGPGRLRLDAPAHVQRRVDVDNLAKFVLDSLNGVLYADDQQVVSLHCLKLYDDDDERHCLGKSVMRMHVMTPEELQEKIK